MQTDVIIALISLGGTAAGSLTGVLAASRLTNYRIEQLEKKVDKHNCLIDRMYKVEDRCDLNEEKLKVASHRIDDLEKTSH